MKEITPDDIDEMMDSLFELGEEFKKAGDIGVAGKMLRTAMRMGRSDSMNRAKISKLEKENALLRSESLTDPLTGVPNRRGFELSLIHELAEAKRFNDGSLVSIAYVDLDGFKAINDKFGHETGDDVLKDVTKRMAKVLRETDIVARIGGDEIAVIMPYKEGDTFSEDVARGIIRGSLTGLCVWDRETNTPYPVGASIGVVSSDDQGLISYKDSDTKVFAYKMVNMADERMYRDKWLDGIKDDEQSLKHPKNARLRELRAAALRNIDEVDYTPPILD